jgi:quinohemoprotein ethanol dehydrogenase
MQAPKNGFFFVVDRETGEFLSAEMFTQVNWASGYDKKGRPIETPDARKQEPGDSTLIWGGGGGAHSWQPMSFSPLTKLVYLPGQNRPFRFEKDPNFKFQEGKSNTGMNFGAGRNVNGAALPAGPTAYLLAWDPATQKERWRITLSGGTQGGSMATAGNLVFHGSGEVFAAYDATSGAKLWETTLTAPFGTPVSYELNGVQYVAVPAGTGTRGRLYTFALDGKAAMPTLPLSAPAATPPKPAAQ